MRIPLLVVAVALSFACGPLTPPAKDAGTGGGTTASGGGTTGGGTALGGGSGTTGGGGATGGGSATGGGGSTGGGSVGGGSATGGGAASGGGGGAPGALRWATISLSGTTSTGTIIGISGTATDLYALEDNGNLYHSTGAGFSFVTKFAGGVKGLHVEGSLIVVLNYRAIRWCSSNCTTESAFQTIDLVSPGLDAEVTCGRSASTIAVVVSDLNSNGQLYEWNGTTFTRTNQSLGLHYPRSCWYSTTGVLHIGGENKVAVYDQGAATLETLTSMGSTTVYGGFATADSMWTAAGGGKIFRKPNGGAWSEFTTNTTTTLWTVGGPSANEVYIFGFFASVVGNGLKWNGMTLLPTGDILPAGGTGSLFRASLVTGPDEMYVGGSNSSGPVIVRARR